MHADPRSACATALGLFGTAPSTFTKILQAAAASPAALQLGDIMKAALKIGISAFAVSVASPVAAQEAATDVTAAAESTEPEGEILVTGVRQSLEKAAQIKQGAVQIVDTIVAQDIGKFPDPTTAAALQRVPGVQVQYDKGNELSDVRVRGLPDTLTTVNGREVFSATARNFDLKDLPAEALARVDVVKSQTADLIEGGLAGTIDLHLNRPFAFRDPTVILTARTNYGVQTRKFNPQLGLLATDRWDTGLGEMGITVNATYNRSETFQPETTGADPRATATSPLNTAQNYIFPSIFQNITQSGAITHAQGNASYQWQISPAVQFYAEGFYTYTKNTVSYSGGGNVQPYTTGTSISDVVASNDCYTARFNSATGQNANVVTDNRTGERYIVAVPAAAGGAQNTGLYKVQELCFVKSATLNNVVINQATHADNYTTRNKMFAGGLKYDRDATRATFDLAYQTTRNYDEAVTADVGQRLAVVNVETDVGGGPRLTIPGDALSQADNLYLRNSISQNYQLSKGDLFAARGHLERDLESFLTKIEVGARYARRTATYRQYNAVTPIPFGNLGTGSEGGNATIEPAKRVQDILQLPSDFLEFGPGAPGINGGQRFLVPSVDFLRSDRGRDLLRGVFGLPLGQPDYQKSRQFNAEEQTYALYGQASYAFPLGSTAELDGVVGVRATRTERSLDTFSQVGSGANATYVPTTTRKTDTDILPNASARLRFDNGLQLRLAYAKTIRRPNLSNLNPSLNLTLSANPFLVNTGSAGNPDLRPQKSDSLDASVEYYFPSGYVAVTGYYRNIVDRVITAPAIETFAGVDYAVTRPRNLGKAELKGVEISGQYFFDFLPGALSGIGAFGAFTFSDSLIKGDDPLAGQPLQGVSKYNYTAGLLYDKHNVSARLVYTFRSKSWLNDATGNLALRPVDPARAHDPYVPVLFRWLRPNGRVDFSLGYDISDAIRIDIGGTNLLRTRNKTYWGVPFVNSQVFRIDSTYTAGIRVKL